MKQGDELNFEEKPIDQEAMAMINDANVFVKRDLERLFQIDVSFIEPYHLDKLLPFYKKGTFWSKTKREGAIMVLGASLGQIIVDKLGFEWIYDNDRYGEELAIRHAPSHWRAFPFSSVRKRIRTSEEGYFTAIYNSFNETIKNKTEGEHVI